MPLCLPTCCIKRCVRRDGDRNASVLHKWPTDGGIANIWKTNIKSVQPDFDLSKHDIDELFICSDHFEDDCFKISENGDLTDVLLSDGAPTIFPKVALKRTKSSNDTGSDSSTAMKIVVKRTVQNEWKINNENVADQAAASLPDSLETVETVKIKPQPIVLRMRRKSKKHPSLRMRNTNNGCITKNPSLIQANAIKAKYENRRKHKFMNADRNAKFDSDLSTPVSFVSHPIKIISTKLSNILIAPHKFEITVPYGCNSCGHLAYNICDYILHIKDKHNKRKDKPTKPQTPANQNASPFITFAQQPLQHCPIIQQQRPIIPQHQVPMMPKTDHSAALNLNKSDSSELNNFVEKSDSSNVKLSNETSSFESSSIITTPPKSKEAKKVSPSKVQSKLDEIVSNLMVARKESIESNEFTKEGNKQVLPETIQSNQNDVKDCIKSETLQESTDVKWPTTNTVTTKMDINQPFNDHENTILGNLGNSNASKTTSHETVTAEPHGGNEKSDTPGEVVGLNTTQKSGVCMKDYDHVKHLRLSKEVISIFEEAFDTFPYLSEADYQSLSVITRVSIKDMEKIFETARIQNSISWEKHHITAAAASLGKSKG